MEMETETVKRKRETETETETESESESVSETEKRKTETESDSVSETEKRETETETESEESDSESERGAYIMLRGKQVRIEKIHTLESGLFWFCYGSGTLIPLKIKSPCLEKAMEFCKDRGLLQGNPAHILDTFDHEFLQEVRQSGLNLVDLYHAAARLEIDNLENLLFDDVYCILCDDNKTTPEQLDNIFKVRYNDVTSPKILEILDLAPPCPTLSEEEQEQMKLKQNREEILKVSSSEFKNLTHPKKIYWLYAHFIIKRNPGIFIELKQISRKAAESDVEDEPESKQEESEDESKVPKNDHDVGGPGPRGLA